MSENIQNVKVISIDDLDDDDITLSAIIGGSEDEKNQQSNQIIGTLKEKSLHNYLKNYYEPDEKFQEQKFAGYVADIYKNGKIIEIQTGSFGKMREKLKTYFDHNIPVKIVYPVRQNKWIIWIDQETGQTSNKRKSPKQGSVFSIFDELVYLKELVNNPLLSYNIVLCDVEDYKILNGWDKHKKKGANRYDSIPVKINEIIEINNFSDFLKSGNFETVISNADGFCVSDIAESAFVNLSVARKICYVLKNAKVIHPVGKRGRKILYKKID